MIPKKINANIDYYLSQCLYSVLPYLCFQIVKLIERQKQGTGK